MDKIGFDIHKKRYYVGNKDEKRYLCCGDNIRFIKDREEKTGQIQYSCLVSRGYYISLDEGKTFVPLFMINNIL